MCSGDINFLATAHPRSLVSSDPIAHHGLVLENPPAQNLSVEHLTAAGGSQHSLHLRRIAIPVLLAEWVTALQLADLVRLVAAEQPPSDRHHGPSLPVLVGC